MRGTAEDENESTARGTISLLILSSPSLLTTGALTAGCCCSVELLARDWVERRDSWLRRRREVAEVDEEVESVEEPDEDLSR